MYPRSGVAAVIIHDENLSVVKKRDEKGIMYSFPTGGQEPGETLVQAVQREVLEEVGCEIVVGPLVNWLKVRTKVSMDSLCVLIFTQIFRG